MNHLSIKILPSDYRKIPIFTITNVNLINPYMLGWCYLIFLGVLILAVLVLGVCSLINPKLFKDRQSKIFIGVLLFISIGFVLFSLLMPWIMPEVLKITGNPVEKVNELGDAIGGLMNPFIAISAVIVTGLAFYMQYQANQQIQDQFKIQQIESQFYEMLNLHKENVKEIEIVNEGNSQVIAKGRSAFTIFKIEFEMALEMLTVSGDKLNHHSFYLLYRLFFDGLKNFDETETTKHFPFFVQRLKSSQIQYIAEVESDFWELQDEYYRFYHNYDRFPFLGQVNDLGHYYRHLFQTVKYIVTQYNNGILKYDNAMNYLKILRAQLSDSEQVMLFYNWIAGIYNKGYGSSWENNENQYFTEFKMIHNLPLGFLFAHDFIKQKVQNLREIPTSKRQGNLFEWDD